MAAVGAALKKILVTLLTSKKGRKVLLYTVLVILLVIFMPILAVVAVLNSDTSYDISDLTVAVAQNLSAEEQARLQQINDTGVAIHDAMNEAGFNARIKEAEVLFILALSDHMGEDDFVSRLVGCFAEGQTDAQLIAAVNAEFGKELLTEDFTHVMESIRAVFIDTSRYTDPSTKNNLDLVQYAIEAEQAGWGYVWGTYGLVLTEARFEAKLEQYLWEMLRIQKEFESIGVLLQHIDRCSVPLPYLLLLPAPVEKPPESPPIPTRPLHTVPGDLQATLRLGRNRPRPLGTPVSATE